MKRHYLVPVRLQAFSKSRTQTHSRVSVYQTSSDKRPYGRSKGNIKGPALTVQLYCPGLHRSNTGKYFERRNDQRFVGMACDIFRYCVTRSTVCPNRNSMKAGIYTYKVQAHWVVRPSHFKSYPTEFIYRCTPIHLRRTGKSGLHRRTDFCNRYLINYP